MYLICHYYHRIRIWYRMCGSGCETMVMCYSVITDLGAFDQESIQDQKGKVFESETALMFFPCVLCPVLYILK